MTEAELQALRDDLARARLSGTLEVSVAGRSVRYRSDAEIRRAIADADRQLGELRGSAPVSQVRFRTSKGL